jgi:chemotaxis protein MotB
MARKKIHEEHENLERWLVSYADFITLLFAFFVVMYAISSVNEGKYRVLSDSIVQAFQEKQTDRRLIDMGHQNPSILPGTGKPIGKATQERSSAADKPDSPETAHMKSIARDVMTAMASLVQKGQVKVTQSPRGITVEINASTLFPSGEATLAPASVEALSSVAKVLAQTDNPIQVEGHTDNVPIKGGVYPSNWELSSARAAAVVRLLAEQGVPPGRMVAIGYADNKPLDTNATTEGRARNRRVNVLILNKVADGKELKLTN